MPSAERMIKCRPFAVCRQATGDMDGRRRSRHCSRCRFPSSSSARNSSHREHHSPNAVQLSTLLSIKTGGCPEDCGYCPQAKRYHTGVDDEKLARAFRRCVPRRARRRSKAPPASAWARHGADRRTATSCRCSSWCASVKALGLETCCTLGMLKDGQAEALKAAGLDYYNHNLDTAPDFYGEIDQHARLRRSARYA